MTNTMLAESKPMDTRNHARLAPLIAVLLTTGCAVPDWQQQLSPGTCDQVVHEVEGFGSTREQARKNAVSSAITSEFGAIVSSEMVLEGNELVVNRKGQVSRGMLDYAIAIDEAKKVPGSEEYSLLTRVVLCRNIIAPNQRSAPLPVTVKPGLVEGTQEMIDAKDSQGDALIQRQLGFKASLSSLLNPVTGLDVHLAQVISYTHTGVFPANSSYSRSLSRSLAPAERGSSNEHIGFKVVARVSIHPEVRSNLEQLLGSISMEYHTPGLFGAGHKRMLRKKGFAFVDQRLEQVLNPNLHHSDRTRAPLQTNGVSPQLHINDITIIKGLIETLPDDADVLGLQVSDAIASFAERFTLVGRTEDGKPIVEIPLFIGETSSDVRIERLALYPESAKGSRHDTNGAIFQSPNIAERAWIGRQVTPLRLLRSAHSHELIPALRRGASYLEINLTVARETSRGIDGFTLELSPPARVPRPHKVRR